MKHATTAELLEVKEGKKTPMSAHVLNCQFCAEALAELSAIQEKMCCHSFKLPQKMWPKIACQLEENQNGCDHRKLSRALYTMAASIVIAAFIMVLMLSAPKQHKESEYQVIMQLMMQSSLLENVVASQLRSQQVGYVKDEIGMEMKHWRLIQIDNAIQSADVSDTTLQLVLWKTRVDTLRALKNHITENNTDRLTGEI